MGFMSTVGSLATAGISVAKTAFSLGNGALSTIGSIGKSKIGKTLLISGGIGLAIKAAYSITNSDKTYSSNSFFDTIGRTIKNVGGGIASVANNFVHNANEAVDGFKQETGLTAAAEASEGVDAIMSSFGTPEGGAENGGPVYAAEDAGQAYEGPEMG